MAGRDERGCIGKGMLQHRARRICRKYQQASHGKGLDGQISTAWADWCSIAINSPPGSLALPRVVSQAGGGPADGRMHTRTERGLPPPPPPRQRRRRRRRRRGCCFGPTSTELGSPGAASARGGVGLEAILGSRNSSTSSSRPHMQGRAATRAQRREPTRQPIYELRRACKWRSPGPTDMPREQIDTGKWDGWDGWMELLPLPDLPCLCRRLRHHHPIPSDIKTHVSLSSLQKVSSASRAS